MLENVETIKKSIIVFNIILKIITHSFILKWRRLINLVEMLF